MDNPTTAFIKQTAKDFDMDIDQVKSILYNCEPGRFYSELNQFIYNRKNR